MNRTCNAIFAAVSVALTIGVASMPAHADGTIDKGILKIGSDLTYPPYNYFADGNKPAGFDVELMAALSKAAGLKAEVLDTRFENLIIGVRGSQFDVIASTLYVKPERAKQIDYIPYMKTGVSIAVTTAGRNAFAKAEDLCGHTVGSIKGAAWLEKLAALNEGVCKGKPIDSREFPTSPETTQALLSGGVDAQLEDSAVLQDTVTKLGGRVKITSKENLYPVVVGFGVRKGNDALAATLRKAMATLQANGSYDALLKKFNVSKPSEAEFKAAVGG
jgi:polar amino acid transport system substrate-binding protein